MRKITKLMFALAMFAGGVTNASAVELEIDLSKIPNSQGTNATWDSSTGVFEWNQPSNNLIDLPIGGQNDFAPYTTLNFEIEKGENDNASETFRFLFYCIGSGQNADAAPTCNVKDNSLVLSTILTPEKLSTIDRVCIAGAGGVASGSIVIKRIWFEGPDDPLAVPRQNLRDAIALANMQHPFAKTAESYAELQKAVEEARNVLNTATEADELTAAMNSVNKAFNGLELEDGYSNLTKDMYNDPYCAYALNESTGTPYGHSGVPASSYADLSSYDKLVIVVNEGTPRLMLNRKTDTGSDNADESLSEMIEINANTPQSGEKPEWATKRYQTISEDNKVFTIDLAMIVKEKEFARLNCIKGASFANITVTGMYLYKAPEEITVKVNNGTGYRTFVSEYATDWSKVTDVVAYTATITGDEVTFEQVNGAVPANTGLLLKASDGTYKVPVAEEAGDVESALVGVTTATPVPAGSFVLYNKGGKVGFYKTGAEFTVGANTAYIPAVAGARTFIALPGNEATGVKAIEAVEADGKFYDLQGRQVSNPTKGLYISNGKKFVVK